jgi:adenylate cyclase
MIHEDDVVGVVSVFRSERRPFSDDEIHLLSTFADQASLAIATSRLVATVEGQRKELARYLPEQVAELISSPEGLAKLEGHRSEITVVFTDLRDFTAFASSAEPEEVIEVLREYHETMGGLVRHYEGTLGGFAGDGLMIFFNDPTPMPHHAGQAITMSKAMQTAFMPLSEGWQRRGFDLGLGIGVATGYTTLGRIGYEGRYDYGPIGTIVNLASRLCERAPRGAIMVSQRTLVSAEIDDASPVGTLELKGFAQPVPAFRVDVSTID